MNKLFIVVSVIVLSSCHQINKKSNDDKLVYDYFENTLNEIVHRWSIEEINEYVALVSSPSFSLDNTNQICVIKTLVLRKASNGDFLPLNEQLINNHSFFKYALKENNYKNCEDIEKSNYFTISDINKSDKPNYGLFNIAKLIKNKQWLKDEKSISYGNQVAEDCMRLKSDLSILKIQERGFSDKEELYLAKLNCIMKDKSHYIELSIYYNVEDNQYDYWAVNTVQYSH